MYFTTLLWLPVAYIGTAAVTSLYRVAYSDCVARCFGAKTERRALAFNGTRGAEIIAESAEARAAPRNRDHGAWCPAPALH